MCRPGGESVNKSARYSWDKKFHCLIYQTITIPDGIIFNLFGQETRKSHELNLYRDREIENVFQ